MENVSLKITSGWIKGWVERCEKYGASNSLMKKIDGGRSYIAYWNILRLDSDQLDALL